MSLQAMTQALGKTMTMQNRSMTINQISERILIELHELGYELKPLIDTGLSPIKQGVIELHVIFQTMMDEGFKRDEAFALTERILDGQMTRWTKEGS